MSFALWMVTACGGEALAPAPLSFADASTTTTSIVSTTDDSANEVERPPAIDLSSDDPATRCGIERPVVGEIELLENDYLAVVASPGSVPELAFDRVPESLSLHNRSAVCLREVPSGATRGCGVQASGGDPFTLHLAAATFVATVVMEDGSPPYQTEPMHVVEDCPGDPNDANPTLFALTASSDAQVASTVVGRDELFELVSAAVVQWQTGTSEEPLSANRCESLALTVERLAVLHDDLATFLGDEDVLFPSVSPAATSAQGRELQAQIDWFGEASRVSLVRFEGDAIRILLAELHLNMILWNDVAEAVAERQDSVPDELRGAWLHWRLGNALRSSSIVHAAATEAHLAAVVESRCSPEDRVVSDVDPAPVCAELRKVYERRNNVRSDPRNQVSGMFDVLWAINELHPPGLNPFFDPSALEALINVEYALDAERRLGRPMDRIEVAADEAAAEQIDVFVEDNCPEIDASWIRVESALEALPPATAAEVSEQRGAFCATLYALTEQRAVFRSGVGNGTPQGVFPEEYREAWDELRRLGDALGEQLREHGASIEPDPEAADSLRQGRINKMLELENALRLWVFSAHPVPVQVSIEWYEEETAGLLGWGERHCAESFRLVPSVTTYDFEAAPEGFATSFPSEAEVAAAFCPRLEDALHARLAFQHQLTSFDLTDEDRVSDIELTTTRFRNATFSIEYPYELNGGNPDLAYAFTDSVWGALWSVLQDEQFSEWELETQEQTRVFLADVPRVCPDLPDLLIDGLGSMETLAENARLRSRPAPVAAFGERFEVRDAEADGSETVWAITVGPIVDHTDTALANGAETIGPDGRFLGFEVSITLVASSSEERWVHGDLEPILYLGEHDWVYPHGCGLERALDDSAFLSVGETATGTVCGEVPDAYVRATVPAMVNELEVLFFG